MAELPVMPIHTVTGPEYMDALARLGYNVENMTSPLPIISKIAEAGSNMLDRAYQQNLQYQEAQGRLALSKAQADHIDSETAYNNMTMDTRAKSLDLEAQIKEMDAKQQRATLDSSIAAVNAKNAMTPQIEQNNLDTAKNNAQRSKLELDGATRAGQIQKEALDDWPNFVNDLAQPGDPDFYKKNADAFSHHNSISLDPQTMQRAQAEIKARTDAHERLASTIAQHQDTDTIIKQHEAGYIDDGTFRNINQIVADPVARQRVLAKSRVTQASMEVNDLLAQFPRDPAEIASLPPLIQQQRTELMQMANDMRPLSTDEGLERVVGGNHLDLFDQNGNLNPKLKGDMSALRTWLTERQKQAAAKGMGATEITVRVPNPEDPTKFIREFKTTVPTDELQQTLQSFQQQGLQATPTGQETPQQKQAVQAGTSTTLQRMAAQDPAIQNLLIQAGQQGNKEARDELRRRYQAAIRGMQEGGPVTTTSTADTPASTDTVPAMLTPGEYVINRDAARNIGQPALDRMNQTGAETRAPQMHPLAGSNLPTLPMPSPSAQTRQQQPQRPVDVSHGVAREAPASRAEAVAATPSQTPAVTTGPVANPAMIASSPLLRAEAYGPQSEGATAADQKQTQGAFVQTLQKGHIAVSPDLLGRYPPHSQWDAVDAKGNIVRRGLTVADTSWIGPGQPTHNTVELYNDADLGQVRLIPAQAYQDGGTVTDPTLSLDTSQGTQDAATLALLASQSAAAQMGPAGYQHGGFVEGGELGGGGGGGELGGRGGGGELGGRGTGGELGDPLQQQTRHRRFRPRLLGQQRIMGPTIPDEMQRKLAKLSHDYLSGLSGLIQSKPEIGPALIRHARNQLAANMGAPGEEEQMQMPGQTMPADQGGYSPAQYAMTAQMDEAT